MAPSVIGLEQLQDIIKDRDMSKLRSYLGKLKRKCASKASVVAYLEKQMDCYRLVLNAMDQMMAGSWELKGNPAYTVTFKELISVVANLVHFSVTAATELKKQNSVTFPSAALKVLESGLGLQNDAALKAALLRLLSNLAEYRETMSLVTGYSSLLDKVALMLNDSESSIYEAAIRVVKQVGRQKSHAKHVLLSNGAYHLGLKVVSLETADLVKDLNMLVTLEFLSKFAVNDFTRQFAQSNCASALLQLLYMKFPTDEAKAKVCARWKQLVLFMTNNSFHIREMFNRPVIEEVIGSHTLDRYLCSFLICFTTEAYGRSALRLEGGLARIMERLAIASLPEQADIVDSFHNFIHDAPGLSFICHQNQLMDLCLQRMRELEETHEHQFGQPPEDHMELAIRGEFDMQISMKESMFRSLVPPPRRHDSYSPPQFPHSPTASPVYAPSSPRSSCQSRDLSPAPGDAWFNYSADEESNQSAASKPPRRPEHIASRVVWGCVWLYRFISHDDAQLDFLVHPAVLTGFVRHLARTYPINERLAHVLKGVARARLHINRLLELRFPYVIIEEMVRRPCVLTRFRTTCARCAEQVRSGIEILSDFIVEVDTAFGQGVLELTMSQPGPPGLYGHMHSLILIRNIDRRNRVYGKHNPIKTLLDYAAKELAASTPETLQESKLLEHIFASLAFPISRRYLSRVITRIQGGLYQKTECTFAAPAPDAPQVIFKLADGTELIRVGKEELKSTRGYFQGLLDHSFIENSTNHVEFEVDLEKEECDAQDFIIFVHYLSGCRDADCVQVPDARTCVSLLHLADKYLCADLAEELLRANGAARRHIDGDTLLAYLPVVLGSWLYRDRFGLILALVFLKLSDSRQQFQCLRALAGNPVSIQLFFQLISHFLREVLRTAGPWTSFLSWDF